MGKRLVYFVSVVSSVVFTLHAKQKKNIKELGLTVIILMQHFNDAGPRGSSKEAMDVHFI